MPDRQSPFDAAFPIHLGQIVVDDATPPAMGEAQCWARQSGALGARLADWAGTELPDIGHVAQAGERGFVQIAPARMAYWGPDAPAINSEIGTQVDLSHARAVLALHGPDVKDLLARVVAVDLREKSFPIGRAVTTPMDHIPILLHRTGADNWSITCLRSYALSQLRYLERIAGLQT